MNVNIIGELRALHTELARYQADGRDDRAVQVQHEISGRVAVVRDAITQLDRQAEVAEATEDHVTAAEAKVKAAELREGLADVLGDADDEPTDDDTSAAADAEPAAAEPTRTAASKAPRERAVPAAKK
ncbi:hypothetical protein Lesp02_84050 [Lentzea sp. NBRC 105346]|uniref:hypothetical protein n=1 Tax=Lentzea sp. NBRC 105346 TaxID=3032205 RepID=UPI0024A56292|nr:hypothetical protein [Lentzea sp. NBRC 105346]GLZ36218.1 hypothetical protein Lesp02_84050 [Lentzea sp. NBRC 105346]